jgi:hypothetical protein
MTFGSGAKAGKKDEAGEKEAKEELASASGPAKTVLPIDFAMERIAH